MRNLVIKRKEWTGYYLSPEGGGVYPECGDDSSCAMLYFGPNNERYQCCLGHDATACGLPDSQLLHKGTAYSLPAELSPFFGYESEGSSKECAWEAIGLNDDKHMALANKEAALIELFAKNGINLSFVDDVSEANSELVSV